MPTELEPPSAPAASEVEDAWPRGPRPNGFLILALVVLAGFLSGAAYFFYKQPKLAERTRAELEAADSTPEGKLAYVASFLLPHIHNALTSRSRLSAQQPWLVTHAVRSDDPSGALDVWGIEVAGIGQDLARVEGLDVVVRLPEPRLLARTHLVGDRARDVPVYAPGEVPFDPRARLSYLASYFLRDIVRSVPDDVAGARIVIEVGSLRTPAAASGD